VRIEKFYARNHCEKAVNYEKLLYKEGRYGVLKKATKMVCTLLAAGTPKAGILSQIKKYLEAEYAKQSFSFSWQRNQHIYDTLLYQRMLNFLQERFVLVCKAQVATCAEVSVTFPDSTNVLEGIVDLILRDKDGGYHGIIIHSGTCSRSMRGKSPLTKSETDLHCMVAKYSLEEQYPGIVIHPLYLTHKQDTAGAIRQQLEVSEYATSNFQSISYSAYYMDGTDVFSLDTLLESIEAVCAVMPKENCFDCDFGRLCNSPLLSDYEKVEKEELAPATYRMPQYTQQQLEVIHHVDGPMRVCAGPGSGKTATLIGRIRYLVEDCHVPPQCILLVTFSREATQELKTRCLSFLEEDNLPKISTIHAFCYGVLRDNQDLLGKELKVLSKREQQKIIKNMVSVMPQLTGFKYGKEEGKTGVYATIANRLDMLAKLGREEFFFKYPELGQDFIAFSDIYGQILESQGYLTFDEQISLCNQLFRDYPEVLSMYSSLYKYCMVDEYQDVNEEQVTLVYQVASHGNLVVVGDDDQNIYGFRGASAEFMKRFPEVFANTKTVIFQDNFRSTDTLVGAAQALIRNNKDRIEKDIRSGSGKTGVEPIMIPSLSPVSIDRLIADLIKEGYSYGDIAILSSKNAPLEELHSELKAPTVLAKSYLRNDGLFLFLYTSLALYQNRANDLAFLQFLSLFGKADCIRRKQDCSLYSATLMHYGLEPENPENGLIGNELEKPISLLLDVFMLLGGKPSISVFVDACKYMISWESTNSSEVLLEQLAEQEIKDFSELLPFMDNLVLSQDETRVEVDTNGKVTLITCHDSKGKEYPIVIIRNDYTSLNEDVRRVFYVAITRAKEQLFILQGKDCKVDFLQEIPHRKEERYAAE